MATENSVLPSQENNINYIKKYIKIKEVILICNTSLMLTKDVFQKHKKTAQ